MFKYFLYNFLLNFLIVIFLSKVDSFNFISYMFGSLAVLISNIIFNRCVNENLK